jgi:hypothetical protein
LQNDEIDHFIDFEHIVQNAIPMRPESGDDGYAARVRSRKLLRITQTDTFYAFCAFCVRSRKLVFHRGRNCGKIDVEKMNMNCGTAHTVRAIKAYLGCCLFAAASVAVLAASASAQVKTLKWDTELCSMSGTYDSSKYTETQLRNTLMLFGVAQPRLSLNLHVWKYEDIAKLDIAAFDREYEQKSKQLRELDIVKVPFWQRLRQDLLKEMEQVYQLERTTASAWTRPEALRDYPGAASCKAKYAGPIIAGGDDLVRVWREVNLDSQKKNADPQRLQRQFDLQNASPDRLKYALVETMVYGWGNCANAFVQRPLRASDGTADREFRKLFRKIRERCDEP